MFGEESTTGFVLTEDDVGATNDGHRFRVEGDVNGVTMSEVDASDGFGSNFFRGEHYL